MTTVDTRKVGIGDQVVDCDGNEGTVLTLSGYDHVPDDCLGVNFSDAGYFIVAKRHLNYKRSVLL